MKKLVIVQEGHWGWMNEGEYDDWIGLVKRGLVDGGAEVEVVATSNDAQKLLEKGNIDAIIFITRGMILAARKLKDQYPDLKVVVLSALPPEEGEEACSLEGLTMVDKLKLTSRKAVQDAIIGN